MVCCLNNILSIPWLAKGIVQISKNQLCVPSAIRHYVILKPFNYCQWVIPGLHLGSWLTFVISPRGCRSCLARFTLSVWEPNGVKSCVDITVTDNCHQKTRSSICISQMCSTIRNYVQLPGSGVIWECWSTLEISHRSIFVGTSISSSVMVCRRSEMNLNKVSFFVGNILLLKLCWCVGTIWDWWFLYEWNAILKNARRWTNASRYV